MKAPSRKYRFKAVFSLIIVLNLFLGLLQLFFANSLATEGEGLRKVEVEIGNLKTENDKIKEQIVALSSLNRIENEAYKIGMTKLTSIEFIVNTEVASVR